MAAIVKELGELLKGPGQLPAFLQPIRERQTPAPEIEYGGFELSAGLYAVSKSVFEARVRKVGRNQGGFT